ncbi:MAG TPA: serine hydrolase [Candidatus Binatia bacterium]|nr:serine hydrolase [Candidatus Binatia bacterium]
MAPPTTLAAPETTQPPDIPPDLGYLRAALDASLQAFDGIAAYYVRDLRRGQVASFNGDVPISGMSMVKIAVLVETYRVLGQPPDHSQSKLITETATLSSNYGANLLMEFVAGTPDPYLGAQRVTESMRRLGLYDTFIAVPYDLEPDPRYFATYATPANQSAELNTNPDSSMQTTVDDMGRLLTLIFDCSMGQGYLLQVFRDSITPGECREIIDVMAHNNIDAFVEEGVPPGIPVAHKHGWVAETHGDAAIVELPGSPYVLVVALHRPGWLEWAESTQIIAQLSRLTYAHFADPNAYSPATLQHDPPPLPAIAPTPDLPTAVVDDTGGAGLVLHQSPEGAEIMILPEGSLVFLLDGVATEVGGQPWRQIRLLNDVTGWVVADFLKVQ